MRHPQRHLVRLVVSPPSLPRFFIRCLAQPSRPRQATQQSTSPISFSPSPSISQLNIELEQPTPLGQGPDAPKPDARTLQLGKTLRTLQKHLPRLLASPLPQEILSPSIRLQLFPSTHPHLPSTTGRVAYHAALWTSPITWGCVPLLGNVHIEILSERMSKPHTPSEHNTEKLFVKWRTKPSTASAAPQSGSKIAEWLGRDITTGEPFTGLFIFEFDDRGRISRHVIEMVDQGREREMGRVVTLTEWLMRRFRGGEPEVGLAVHGRHEFGQREQGAVMESVRVRDEMKR